MEGMEVEAMVHSPAAALSALMTSVKVAIWVPVSVSNTMRSISLSEPLLPNSTVEIA